MSPAYAHPQHVSEIDRGAAHDEALKEHRPPTEIFGRLWFVLGDPGELFIDNIMAERRGWGTAMLMKLQAMYLEKKLWTALSINVESVQFWEKMRSRHRIVLKAGAFRPDHRS